VAAKVKTNGLAAMEARRRAVEELAVAPAHVLVNGKRRIAGRFAQTAVVEGDARSAARSRRYRSWRR
jgi:hypothetical protein